MIKSKIAVAIASVLALGAGNAIADTVTISLGANASPSNPFSAAILPINNAAFTAGNTFRVMNGGAPSGFGEKQIVSGDEVWTFESNLLTAVAGTDPVAAVAVQSASGNAVLTAGAGLFDTAVFFGGDFGFLAPVVGSDAANASGAGSIQNIVGDSFEINTGAFLNTHWQGSGSAFTLGEVEGGVIFSCTGYTSGSGSCVADQIIDGIEDSAGFAGQYTQWEFDVTVDVASTIIPVPAAAWLFGSGLLGLVGVARRKKATS